MPCTTNSTKVFYSPTRFKQATHPYSYRRDRSGTNIHIGEFVHCTCLAAMGGNMGLANLLMLHTLCKGYTQEGRQKDKDTVER